MEVEGRRSCGVASLAGTAGISRLDCEVGLEGVQQRRLPDAALSDKDRGRSTQERGKLIDAGPLGVRTRDDGDVESDVWIEAREQVALLLPVQQIDLRNRDDGVGLAVIDGDQVAIQKSRAQGGLFR